MTALAGRPMSGLLPGFGDPVGDSQRAFRALLDAMARPGTVSRLPVPDGVPVGWSPALAAVALTLFDQDTAVWIDPRSQGAETYLRFHCGCPLVADPSAAAFAVASDAAVAPPLNALCIGDPLYPDRSATLVLGVEALTGGRPLCLSGPGIRGVTCIGPHGLPEGFAGQWAGNHALYPSGVDVILASGDAVIALPRSVAAEEC